MSTEHCLKPLTCNNTLATFSFFLFYLATKLKSLKNRARHFPYKCKYVGQWEECVVFFARLVFMCIFQYFARSEKKRDCVKFCCFSLAPRIRFSIAERDLWSTTWAGSWSRFWFWSASWASIGLESDKIVLRGWNYTASVSKGFLNSRTDFNRTFRIYL